MVSPNSKIDSKYLEIVYAVFTYSMDLPKVNPSVIRAQASMAKATSTRQSRPFSPSSKKALKDSTRNFSHD